MSAVRFSDKNEVILYKTDETDSPSSGGGAPDNAQQTRDVALTEHSDGGGRFTIHTSSTSDDLALLPVQQNIPQNKGSDELQDEDNSDEDDISRKQEPVDMHRPSVFEVVTQYKGGIIQAPADHTKSRQLGTLLGVYFPCIQNILGVIVFIRYPWIIGIAGISGALAICLLCSSCTLLTAFSMSAIATNGRVPAGGSYFMISRSLGPAVGGAVGILFYLANAFSCALYTVGAVEIIIKYICPEKCLLFGDNVEDLSTAFNHYRVYGTLLLILLTIVVLIGIRFVSIIAPVSLLCVLISVLCIFIGLIKAAFSDVSVPFCTMDSIHVLKSSVVDNNITQKCNVNDPTLYNATCGADSLLCEFLNSTQVVYGVQGLQNSQFSSNWKMSFSNEDEVARGKPVLDRTLEVYALQMTNFFIMVGIYFPSVTGIMAGSNRSGDLKDPSKSIPIGTIGAF